MKLYHLYGPLQVFMYMQELKIFLMYVYVEIMSLSFELYKRVVISTISFNW